MVRKIRNTALAVDQSVNGIKRATQQRLQYIELMAYYTGVVSRHQRPQVLQSDSPG